MLAAVKALTRLFVDLETEAKPRLQIADLTHVLSQGASNQAGSLVIGYSCSSKYKVAKPQLY